MQQPNYVHIKMCYVDLTSNGKNNKSIFVGIIINLNGYFWAWWPNVSFKYSQIEQYIFSRLLALLSTILLHLLFGNIS